MIPRGIRETDTTIVSCAFVKPDDTATGNTGEKHTTCLVRSGRPSRNDEYVDAIIHAQDPMGDINPRSSEYQEYRQAVRDLCSGCLLYTSDAADE